MIFENYEKELKNSTLPEASNKLNTRKILSTFDIKFYRYVEYLPVRQIGLPVF